MAVQRQDNIASYAVDLVAALGAGAAFCLTGGMAMYINRAVAQHPRLKAVFNQHEQASANAADGYAKASDFQRPGLAVVTAGPGVTNTITSLCSAFGDSSPVVVLAGQIKTPDIDRLGTRTHGIQEVRSRAIVEPCVKVFARLDAEVWRETLVAALAEGLSGRPGPVFVEIPLDVQNRALSYDAAGIEADVAEIRARIAATRTAEDADALREAIAWLLEGERPLVYAGHGCRIAGAADAVRRLVEAHGLPTVVSWMSADLLPGDHPLNFAAPGGLAPLSANQVLSGADRILFLGGRLDLGTTAFQPDQFGSQAERLLVDADAAELAKFEGQPRTRTLKADLACLARAAEGLPARPGRHAAWRAWCEEKRAAYRREEAERLAIGRLNVYGLAKAFSAWSDGKTFVPTGSGWAIEAFLRFFEPGEGTRCFFGGSLGAMGLGLPQALGATFAGRGRVICVEADGGLMLNLQELATLAHHKPRGFVLFVLNNGGYGSIAASQDRHFGMRSGADEASGVFIPDYGKIAPAFGLPYVRIETLGALEALLPTLDPEAPPVFVDVMIDKEESRGPAVKTVIGADGRLSSTPLSEIQW